MPAEVANCNLKRECQSCGTRLHLGRRKFCSARCSTTFHQAPIAKARRLRAHSHNERQDHGHYLKMAERATAPDLAALIGGMVHICPEGQRIKELLISTWTKEDADVRKRCLFAGPLHGLPDAD